METDQTADLLEQFETAKIRRRTLLPWWIKIFCWIFMFTGIVSLFCLVIGFSGVHVSLAVFGFETNDSLSAIGLFIIAIFTLKGFSAFALWMEKNYAVTLAKFDAIAGIILCIFSMFAIPYLTGSRHIIFRLELVLLVPYLVRLIKIDKSWQEVY